MSWKVLITAPPIAKVGAKAVALLEAAGCEVIHAPHDSLGGLRLIHLLADVDAVIAGAGDRYTAEVLNAPAVSRLKLISRWGVGYDAIDVPAATARGIVVAYTPGMTDGAVADYTFAMLLGMLRRIPQGHQSMREGRWSPIWGEDLSGKSLGILGLGRIGKAVARRALGFDLRVLAHDPHPTQEARDSGVEFLSFDELLQRSDFLTLHAALTPANRGLIGEPQLRQMKPTTYLINSARGPLLDEAALIQALREGWIAGAALDVFGDEPLPSHHPFRTTPNLMLSPHQASSTRETGEVVSRAAAEAILDLREGRRPRFVVNQQALEALPTA